jgi:hypothetical protein
MHLKRNKKATLILGVALLLAHRSVVVRQRANNKGRTMRVVRPLFVTLQSVICDIDGGKGSPAPHYVAKLGALLDLVVE